MEYLTSPHHKNSHFDPKTPRYYLLRLVRILVGFFFFYKTEWQFLAALWILYAQKTSLSSFLSIKNQKGKLNRVNKYIFFFGKQTIYLQFPLVTKEKTVE